MSGEMLAGADARPQGAEETGRRRQLAAHEDENCLLEKRIGVR